MRGRISTILLALLLLSGAGCGGGGGGGGGGGEPQPSSDTSGVRLTWRGGGQEVAGYVVHWGTESHSYTQTLDVGSPSLSPEGLVIVVVTVESAPIYYFAVTSYDASGQSSSYSNELPVGLP